MKKTLRRFTLSVPTGATEPQQIRSYVRASDGTDYPVDREIQVDVFETKFIEQVGWEGSDPALADLTEAWALAQCPAGTLALATQDIVSYDDA